MRDLKLRGFESFHRYSPAKVRAAWRPASWNAVALESYGGNFCKVDWGLLPPRTSYLYGLLCLGSGSPERGSRFIRRGRRQGRFSFGEKSDQKARADGSHSIHGHKVSSGHVSLSCRLRPLMVCCKRRRSVATVRDRRQGSGHREKHSSPTARFRLGTALASVNG